MNYISIPRLLPVFLAGLFSGSAFAAGFQLLEQNASGIGNAYAGSAALADNASTVFYNPAGMTRLRDREYSFGVAAIKPSLHFSNNGSSVPAGPAPALEGNGRDGGSLAFAPNAYLSWALSKDLYAGIGFGAPFGLMTKYQDNWLGAAQSIKFDIKTYNINPSLAYRVNDMLSLGAGISWQRMTVEYMKRAGPSAAYPLAAFTPDDNSWGWNVGAMLTLSPATRIGLSYRSQVKHNLQGTLNIYDVAAMTANADIKLPATAIVSIAHQLDSRWELLGDVSRTGWSSMPDFTLVSEGVPLQRIETAFKDAWRFALGANYRLNDVWKLKTGLAYDKTPVPNATYRLVSLPDNDRTWVSLGTQWKPDGTSAVDLGFAYLFVGNTGIDSDSLATTGTAVRGSYDNSLWIFGAQYSAAF